jgi:CRISPR-associated protein Cmr3
MTPAGSVYFFRIEDDSVEPAGELADRWLMPVSDVLQDCRDGFGLAMWGAWSPLRPHHTFEGAPR